jgi:hypothetical protein
MCTIGSRWDIGNGCTDVLYRGELIMIEKEVELQFYDN